METFGIMFIQNPKWLTLLDPPPPLCLSLSSLSLSFSLSLSVYLSSLSLSRSLCISLFFLCPLPISLFVHCAPLSLPITLLFFHSNSRTHNCSIFFYTSMNCTFLHIAHAALLSSAHLCHFSYIFKGKPEIGYANIECKKKWITRKSPNLHQHLIQKNL